MFASHPHRTARLDQILNRHHHAIVPRLCAQFTTDTCDRMPIDHYYPSHHSHICTALMRCHALTDRSVDRSGFICAFVADTCDRRPIDNYCPSTQFSSFTHTFALMRCHVIDPLINPDSFALSALTHAIVHLDHCQHTIHTFASRRCAVTH